MTPNLLPHEEISVVLWDQVNVVDVSLLLVMSSDEKE
jgi:hypothetical protein